jgi:hypothetical protein
MFIIHTEMNVLYGPYESYEAASAEIAERIRANLNDAEFWGKCNIRKLYSMPV